MEIGRLARFGGLAIILAAALALRLHDVGFGLPSLYDPDEPIFMVLALKLLKHQTLNPGWFGHPGTTTIYLVALIDLVVLGGGLALGQFSSVGDFASAAYADPALLFVPTRIAIALFGVGCVWLTYVLGKRLFGPAVGLISASLVALNSLHILWSQVIRTDVMASFFMLVSLLFAVRVATGGKLRDYLASGAFVGIAIATKWPSAITMVALFGAALLRWQSGADKAGRVARFTAAAVAAALVALFLASPYILLDWKTVLSDVSGEINHGHLGHNGGGFFYNLCWYLLGQAAPAMGYVGLAFAAAGAAIAAVRSVAARWTLLPLLIAFLALICAQSMVWSRWLVPAIPLLCLFAGVAAVSLARLAAERFRPAATVLVAGAMLVPAAAAARDSIAERSVDTRALAAEWAVHNIPPGSTVLIEHLELRLRDQPWNFRFPFGRSGCVDGLEALSAEVSYDSLDQARRGSPIVDIGNVDPGKLGSCRADYAILTYYDLYRWEAGDFPQQLRTYRRLLRGGRTVAVFAPVSGKTGGPTVRIVAIQPH